MSTDYSAVCMTCRSETHLGVRFASGWAFGHGSNDRDEWRRVGEWLIEHLAEDHDVRVMVSDVVPDDFTYCDADAEADTRGDP